MGKSDNYLVIKDSNSPKLKILAACTPFNRFNSLNNVCEPCEVMTRSWGVQDTECLPCSTLRWQSWHNAFNWAQIQRTCREGYTKSILLSTLFPILVFLLATACCCTSYHYQ
jgi:hypothetical protein